MKLKCLGGPGRPATGKKRVILKLDAETDRHLAVMAAEAGITKSELVERAMLRSRRRHNTSE